MERNWLLLLLMVVVSVLDAAPMKNQNVPRCGVEDSKKGKFSLASGYRWRKQHITWSFYGPAPSHIGHQQTIKIISEAFQRWADIVPLKFSSVCSTCKADVQVYFWSRDGPHGVLAYIEPNSDTFYLDDGNPIMVFDKAENWSLEVSGNDNGQYSLFVVAAHEIGHLLGLFHDESSDALMYQVHREGHFKEEDIVPPQDKKELQKIYDSKNSGTKRRTTITRTTPTTKSTTTTATTTTTPPYGGGDDDDFNDDDDFAGILPTPNSRPRYGGGDDDGDVNDDDDFPGILPAPNATPPYGDDDGNVNDDDDDFPGILPAPNSRPPYGGDDGDDDGFPKIPPMPTPGSPPDMENGNNCIEKTVRYGNGYKIERRCGSSYSSSSNSHISYNNSN